MNYQLIDHGEDADIHVFELVGELDITCAPELRDRIVAAIDEGRTRLVFDLSDVTFVDSTVLGVLVGALKRVRDDHGTVTVVCADENIRAVFRLTELDRIFRVVDSVDEALQ